MRNVRCLYRLYLAVRFMAEFGWCSSLHHKHAVSALFLPQRWLCFDKSWSEDHLEKLDITGVGCTAALKTCGFQLLFKFRYIINKLFGFMIAHKG